jgi:hypothetical protein
LPCFEACEACSPRRQTRTVGEPSCLNVSTHS